MYLFSVKDLDLLVVGVVNNVRGFFLLVREFLCNYFFLSRVEIIFYFNI